jgi:hypothetical protein
MCSFIPEVFFPRRILSSVPYQRFVYFLSPQSTYLAVDFVLLYIFRYLQAWQEYSPIPILHSHFALSICDSNSLQVSSSGNHAANFATCKHSLTKIILRKKSHKDQPCVVASSFLWIPAPVKLLQIVLGLYHCRMPGARPSSPLCVCFDP